MTVHEITSLANFKEAIANNHFVVIDAWATWCGPCRVISPIFEKLSDSNRFPTVYFAKVDVDAVPDLAQELGIRAMPTFIAFKDGEKVQELVGANPVGLETLLNSLRD
ncbi:thioredoxin trx1 [Neurospora sp. IMI 360204]|nr:thioredoxin trx1 [Neurospora sp. IMI 360204]